MRIAEARKNAGFSTQEQLAKKMGIPRSTLAKWEAGITKPPSDKLPELARIFGCSIDDLFAETQAKEG